MSAAGKTQPVGNPRTDRLQGSVLAEDLSFLLARANALALTAANSALAKHGLRARSYSVLALATDVGPTQRELAEFLRLDPSQVVALVDELEKRGLVQRHPDPSDRRANVVVATDVGRTLFAKAQRSARSVEKSVIAAVDPADRARFAEAMRLLAFPADHQ